MKKIVILILFCVLVIGTKTVVSKAGLAGEKYPEPMSPTAVYLEKNIFEK